MKPTRSHPASTDDALVIARVADGDAAALGILFDRYHRDVYAFLSRLRGCRNDLDDLVQTTFVALPSAAGRYDGRASVRAFILGVALQHARRERRRIFRRLMLWQARVQEVDLPEAPRDPEQEAEDREGLQRITTALSRLPEAQRETLVLVQLEGLKGEEVASILGVPVNTIWTRLHHARNTLREALRTEKAR